MIFAYKSNISSAVILSLAILVSCARDSGRLGQNAVVKVNEATLSAEEFSDLLASRLKAFDGLAAKDSAVVAQAKKSIVQDFIVQTVTHDWAQKNQIFVHKELLDEEVSKIRKTYPDDVAFRKALADEGVTYDRWESRLSETLLERQVMNELRKQLSAPTDKDAKDYYQANKNLFTQPAASHLRQIVLKNENSAQLIRKELLAGKSFSDLAKKFSITPEGASGGDLGWVEKGTLDVFDSSLKYAVGAKTPVLKSAFGYHIVDIIARRPAKNLTYEEAKAKIEKTLLASREQDQYSRWLESQILKARVFKDDDFLKKIYVQTRGKK